MVEKKGSDTKAIIHHTPQIDRNGLQRLACVFFIADHEVIRYEISFWSIWVCSVFFPSQCPAYVWSTH